MEKSAAYLLGVQHGMDNVLDLEKTAELLDLLDAPGIEKQAVFAALRKLLGGRAGALAKPMSAAGAKYAPKVNWQPKEQVKKIMRPMAAKPQGEGIKSPMMGGGRTTGR